MGLGGCVILIALGAILTFATDWHVNGVNLDIVGVILIVVGLLGLITFSSVLRRPRRGFGPGIGADEVVEERHHYYDDPRL
ncbi:DUF6458 family protein [Peterkaempfera bronchialis]|uniref:DUF6458 domain-containing protein n=1 Tax=Peterkaempfera bronchialis TaxID=2126346 RepID=A0A345SXU4_9ACTN|nr:DUF6458 family protein [Peterkaempfera bronchialis]AXI78549.1 hypothetical protein C7M71_015040 [Peterkaempfera bronchialis]